MATKWYKNTRFHTNGLPTTSWDLDENGWIKRLGHCFLCTLNFSECNCQLYHYNDGQIFEITDQVLYSETTFS